MKRLLSVVRRCAVLVAVAPVALAQAASGAPVSLTATRAAPGGLPAAEPSALAVAQVVAQSVTQAAVNPTAPGDAAKGRRLFESRCVACHSLEENRVGPALGTVFGRAAGRQPGFVYSAALARANHVWTTDRLQAWLTDPEALVPGQAMGFRVALPQDRLDIATFLQSLAAGKGP